MFKPKLTAWVNNKKKKPETTLSAASPPPGTRETAEHLPRPSCWEKEPWVQPCSEESERPGRLGPGSGPAPTAPEPGSPGAESPPSHLPVTSSQQYELPEDLGVDKPAQVHLKQFPKKQQHNNDCKHDCNFQLIGTMGETDLNIRSKQMQPFVFPAGNLEGLTPLSQELGMLTGSTLMIRQRNLAGIVTAKSIRHAWLAGKRRKCNATQAV